MYRLIRFYNQNKKAIWQVILVIALIIAIIQVLNYFAKRSNIIENNNNNVVSSNSYENYINDNLNSVYIQDDQSIISGSNINSTTLERNTGLIDEFFKKCNEQNLEEAYNMLTDDCKEQLYSNIDSFKNNYYSKLFDGSNKSIKIEVLTANTYRVTIKEDMLATGKTNNENVKQDYITIERLDNGEYKLNINGYIGKEEINRSRTNDNIKITVKTKNTFMENEIYEIEIENNSENEILLDRMLDPETIYLQDENELKYPAYNTELTRQQLTIGVKEKKVIDIKFYSRFSTTKNIEAFVFSDVVLNNEEYINTESKDSYSTTKFIVSI